MARSWLQQLMLVFALLLDGMGMDKSVFHAIESISEHICHFSTQCTMLQEIVLSIPKRWCTISCARVGYLQAALKHGFLVITNMRD